MRPVDSHTLWAHSRLNDTMISREQQLPFVPAYVDSFCENCGFPFRESDGHRRYCHEYDLYRDHGRCARRRREAQDPEGLIKRLTKTQEANPHSRRTGEYAVAHAWVRLHYPAVDLRHWQPFQTA